MRVLPYVEDICGVNIAETVAAVFVVTAGGHIAVGGHNYRAAQAETVFAEIP